MKLTRNVSRFIIPAAVLSVLTVAAGAAQEASLRIKTKAEILSEAAKSVRQINIEELMELMPAKETFILIDVRTERERNAGYIGGSVWIPRGVLEFKIPEVCRDPEKKIVVYCRKGGRSILAAYALQQMGYRNVLNLKGGINAWGACGCSLYNWHGEIRVAAFDRKEPNPSSFDILKK